MFTLRINAADCPSFPGDYPSPQIRVWGLELYCRRKLVLGGDVRARRQKGVELRKGSEEGDECGSWCSGALRGRCGGAC